MNEAGRNALRAAGLAGVRQIKGELEDGDGRCGIGVLLDTLPGDRGWRWAVMIFTFELRRMADGRCPICGVDISHECELLSHANDDHGCDFVKLASIMPVSEEEEG